MDVRKKRQSKKRRTEAGISYNTPDSRANVDNPKRKKIRCGDREVYGHNSANCRKKQVDLDTEVPEF
uniref:Uncharacterized protein n=1 Tax=Arundo donax TaxID=35708 RepID=A0A0A8Y941_ARUDO